MGAERSPLRQRIQISSDPGPSCHSAPQDISRNTVIRAEVDLCTAWLAASREYNRNVSKHVHSSSDDFGVPGFVNLKLPIRACSIRSDATNSNIWNNNKLHNTEALMAFVRQLPSTTLDANSDGKVLAHSSVWRTFADLTPVSDSSAAARCAVLSIICMRVESESTEACEYHFRCVCCRISRCQFQCIKQQFGISPSF